MSQFNRIVRELPSVTPFVGPEALERRIGRPLRLRLGANESAFGPSPRAIENMMRAAHDTWMYADPEAFELREMLAELHCVQRENIAVGAGIDDLLGLIARATVEPGVVAVAPLGSYPIFPYTVLAQGGTLERVPYVGIAADIEGMIEAVRRVNPRLVYLANPDNPSGSLTPKQKVMDLLAATGPNSFFVLDEAYAEFATNGELPQIEAADPRVIRLRTFSKVFGMAGSRIGYAIAAPETIASWNKIKLHFSVNRVAIAAAIGSLEDTEHEAMVIRENANGLKDYSCLAQSHGLESRESHTNFQLWEMGSEERAKQFLEDLLQLGVFIRMPFAEPLNTHVRMSVGPPEHRALLREILAEHADALGLRANVNA